MLETATVCLRVRSVETVPTIWNEEHQPLLRDRAILGSSLYRAVEGGRQIGAPAPPEYPYWMLYDFLGDWSRAWDRVFSQWRRALRGEYSFWVLSEVFRSPDAVHFGAAYETLFVFDNALDFSGARRNISIVIEEFNRWYDTVHVVKEIPMGFTRARRFRHMFEPWRYTAIYELRDRSCLYSEENMSVRGMGPFSRYSGAIDRCVGEKVAGYVDQPKDVVYI